MVRPHRVAGAARGLLPRAVGLPNAGLVADNTSRRLSADADPPATMPPSSGPSARAVAGRVTASERAGPPCHRVDGADAPTGRVHATARYPALAMDLRPTPRAAADAVGHRRRSRRNTDDVSRDFMRAAAGAPCRRRSFRPGTVQFRSGRSIAERVAPTASFAPVSTGSCRQVPQFVLKSRRRVIASQRRRVRTPADVRHGVGLGVSLWAKYSRIMSASTAALDRAHVVVLDDPARMWPKVGLRRRRRAPACRPICGRTRGRPGRCAMNAQPGRTRRPRSARPQATSRSVPTARSRACPAPEHPHAFAHLRLEAGSGMQRSEDHARSRPSHAEPPSGMSIQLASAAGLDGQVDDRCCAALTTGQALGASLAPVGAPAPAPRARAPRPMERPAPSGTASAASSTLTGATASRTGSRPHRRPAPHRPKASAK
jgi:hypothetical protein